jgi:hypothetical protein
MGTPFPGRPLPRPSPASFFLFRTGAAVMCFGAGGGDPSPGTISRIGRRTSNTWYCCANSIPRAIGIQVPVGITDERLHWEADDLLTLTLAVTALHLFMRTHLHLPFQYPRSLRLVKVGYLEDMCCIDPSIVASSHDDFLFDDHLIYRSAIVQRSDSAIRSKGCVDRLTLHCEGRAMEISQSVTR